MLPFVTFFWKSFEREKDILTKKEKTWPTFSSLTTRKEPPMKRKIIVTYTHISMHSYALTNVYQEFLFIKLLHGHGVIYSGAM